MSSTVSSHQFSSLLAFNSEGKSSWNYKFYTSSSRTSCGMCMENMNILWRNVMRYGHILRQHLKPFGEIKFLDLLFYRIIFLLMRLDSYPSVFLLNELFLVFPSFTFKMTQFLMKTHSYIFLSWAHEILVTDANTQAFALWKKVMRYWHILRCTQVRNEKNSPRQLFTFNNCSRSVIVIIKLCIKSTFHVNLALFSPMPVKIYRINNRGNIRKSMIHYNTEPSLSFIVITELGTIARS